MWKNLNNSKIAILEETQTTSAKKKRLELELVLLIENFQSQGVEVECIGIDLCNGVDARVVIRNGKASNPET